MSYQVIDSTYKGEMPGPKYFGYFIGAMTLLSAGTIYALGRTDKVFNAEKYPQESIDEYFDLITCGNCGGESDADNFNECVYCSKQMCNQCGDYNGDCTNCGVAYCYDDSGCGDCGEVCKDCECDCVSMEAEDFGAAEYCSTCQVKDHDSCSLTDGCPCCANTMGGIYARSKQNIYILSPKMKI